jgi:putative ABC transport system substrate-binding protein
MRRRVLSMLGAVLAVAATSTPLTAEQSDQKIARVGYVVPESPGGSSVIPIFWQRLRELGWVEGQNLIIETRWAEGRIDRLPRLMEEVIAAKVDVIVTHSTPGAIAAKNATSTVPIVVAHIGDPVAAGVVASLARPGGNVTGTSLGIDKALSGKYLEFLQETVPHLSVVGIIGNPASPFAIRMAEDLQSLAPIRKLKVQFFKVLEHKELDSAMDQARRQTQAVVVIPDPLTVEHSKKITALAAKYRLPAIYGLPEFIDAGGLMIYSVDRVMLFRRTAEYVDKILRGAKPADLPFEQTTQFTLTVNLRAAHALGLTIPEAILMRADEVIR